MNRSMKKKTNLTMRNRETTPERAAGHRKRSLAAILLLTLTLSGAVDGQTARPGTAARAGSAEAEAPRRTLGRFFDKLRSGRAVTIGWLGEATSAGQGLNSPEKSSCRALVSTWLRSQFPKAEITEINAAVSGTGSLYGTLRLRRDLLAAKPDLVFIEFNRSDATLDEKVVKKAVEGILRQLLIVPQPPEVLLLYPTTARGSLPTESHETIARHYGVPSLDLQSLVATRPGGSPVSALFGRDGILANEAGHRFYAEQIIGFLAAQMKLPATPLPRSIPQPLVSDELNYGEFKALAEVRHDSLWRLEPSADRLLPGSLLVGEKPGAEIETYFEGTVLGLTWLTGPDAGVFEVLIDGKPAPAPLTKIDCHDKSPGLGTAILAGGLGLGEHRLTIRLLDEKNPRSSGNRVKLGYLLVGGQRPERL